MSYSPCHQRVQQYLHRGRGSAWAPPRGCSYADCAGDNTRLGMSLPLRLSDFPSVCDTRPVLPELETTCQLQKSVMGPSSSLPLQHMGVPVPLVLHKLPIQEPDQSMETTSTYSSGFIGQMYRQSSCAERDQGI